MIENNKDTKPINNIGYKKDSRDFNKVLKNLSTPLDTKPWYKKKNTIIASSSILGAGVLATVIAVPLALTSNTTTAEPVVNETITLLNASGNKKSRIDLWNGYATSLNAAPIPPSAPFKQNKLVTPNSPFAKIVYTPEFVTEFINFLIDNLYVSVETTLPIGSITATNAKLIKDSLLSPENKAKFMDNTTVGSPGPYTEYNSLFSFEIVSSTVMFSFVDSNVPANQTINIQLFMPVTGLDLIYNIDKTVSIKIAPHSQTVDNNVKLVVNKFPSTAPTITTAKTYYFKPDSTIKLPSTIMSSFSNFFDDRIAAEIIDRDKFKKNYADLKTSVDVTPTSGLSYWNSYALNFKASNITLLKVEIAKTISEGGIYTFIKDAIPTITGVELGEIKTALATDTSNGLSITPFVSSPAYSDLLFNTLNSSGNKYSLALDITKFTYDVTVNNLFGGSGAIKITPKLTLSGTLTKDVAGTKSTTSFTSKEFDFSKLINITNDPMFPTGGLLGFVDTIINPSATTDAFAKLTNGLVAFNDKSTSAQITAWNDFNKVAANQALILTELKTPDVLYNFIQKNVDMNNALGIGDLFPTIDHNSFKTSINTLATTLSSANLSFVEAATNIGGITLSRVKWGTEMTNVFSKVTIYFGNEVDSIKNINLTSDIGANANMSFSQTVGDSNFTDSLKVIAAAKKRLSIVFEENSFTYVIYFGQKLVDAKQVASPIIIPNTILTPASKFIDAIIK